MGLTATGTNKDFKPVPEGNHMARCYRVIDLGTQDGEFQGQPKLMHKVLIGWELDGEDEDGNPLKTEDGKPFTVSKQYTLSLSKKANLRADLESWRGKAFTEDELKGFDISQLLGVYCMVTVKHEVKGDKTYTNVASVARWPSALKGSKFKPFHENQLFDVDNPNKVLLEELPDWIKEKIQSCMEFSAPSAVESPKESTRKPANSDEFDDCPF